MSRVDIPQRKEVLCENSCVLSTLIVFLTDAEIALCVSSGNFCVKHVLM